jgi:hypothetical protein
MTYPPLPPAGRPLAACFRQVRQRERALATLRGFRREMEARTCDRVRRETRLQLQAMRQLLHALCG